MTAFLHSFDRAAFGLSDLPSPSPHKPSPVHSLSPAHLNGNGNGNASDTPSSSSSEESDTPLPAEKEVFRSGRFHPRATHALPVQLLAQEREEEDVPSWEREQAEDFAERQRLELRAGQAREGRERREGSSEEREVWMEEGREVDMGLELMPLSLPLRREEPRRTYAGQRLRRAAGEEEAGVAAERLDELLARVQARRVRPVQGGVAREALERRRAAEAQKRRMEEEAALRLRVEEKEKERREREEEEKKRERKREKRRRREERERRERAEEQERGERRERAFNAARNGDAQGVRREVAAGMLATGPEKGEGETLLHIAAGNGDLELVQWLIEHGADPKERDPSGKSAFHTALSSTHLPVIQHFLATFPASDGNDGIYSAPAPESNLKLALDTGNAQVLQVVLDSGLAQEGEVKDSLALFGQSHPGEEGLQGLLTTHLVSLTPPAVPTHTSEGEEKLSRKQRKLLEKKARARARAEELGLVRTSTRSVQEQEAVDTTVQHGEDGAGAGVPEPAVTYEEPPSSEGASDEEVEQHTGAAGVTILAPVAEPVEAEVKAKAEAEVEQEVENQVDAPVGGQVEEEELDIEAPPSPFLRPVFRIGTYSAPPRYVSLPDDDEEEEDVEEPERAVDDAGFRSLSLFRWSVPQVPAHDDAYEAYSPLPPVPKEPVYPYQPSAFTEHSPSPYSSASYPHTPSPPMPVPSPPQPLTHSHSHSHLWQTEVSPGGVMTGGEKFLFGMLGGAPPTPPEPLPFDGRYELFQEQGFYEPEPGPPGFPYQQQSEPYHETYASPSYTHVPVAMTPPPSLSARPINTALNAFAQPFVPRFNSVTLAGASITPPTEVQTPIPRPVTPPSLDTPPYVPLSNTVSRNSTELSSPVAPNTPVNCAEVVQSQMLPPGKGTSSVPPKKAMQPATPADVDAAADETEEQVYTVRLPGSRSASQSPAPTVLPDELPDVKPQPAGKGKHKKWYKGRAARAKATGAEPASAV